MNVRAVAMPVIAAGIAVGIWLILPTTAPSGPTPIPAATWRVGAETDFHQIRNYEELAEETALRLSYSCSEPRHVYVFSHSAEDGTLLLFPSPQLKGSFSNPVAAGQTLLPGMLDEQPMAWTNRAEILTTTAFVVIAAKQPIEELESLLPHLRRWTNSVLPNKSMQITNPAEGTEVMGKPRTDWPSPLMKRAAKRALAETIVNGPLHADEHVQGVWSSCVRVRESQKKEDQKK